MLEMVTSKSAAKKVTYKKFCCMTLRSRLEGYRATSKKFESIFLYDGLAQGEVTPIDSVLTPATAVKKIDLNFGP